MPNAGLGHVQVTLAATLDLRICFKHPFLVERKAYEHIDDIRDDVCEVGRLHELGDEGGKSFAPGGVREHMGGTFQDKQVDPVRAEEDDDESCDLGTLLVCTLEVPDAVAKVTVETSGDKTEEIREFQVPVEDLMENPDGGKRNQGIHYADDIVFDKVFHGR